MEEITLTTISGSGILIPRKKGFLEKISTCRGNRPPASETQHKTHLVFIINKSLNKDLAKKASGVVWTSFFHFFCFFLFCFFVYMLAATVFYGWPALLTFGFSGNPALLLLVLNCHDCCLFESNKYLLLLLYPHFWVLITNLPKFIAICESEVMPQKSYTTIVMVNHLRCHPPTNARATHSLHSWPQRF